MMVGTGLGAVLAADALLVIVLHGAIFLVDVSSAGGAHVYASGRMAVVAGAGIMEGGRLGKFPYLEALHLAEEVAHF
jgi:hypothetical protein